MKLNYNSNSTTETITKVVLPIKHKVQVNKIHVKQLK